MKAAILSALVCHTAWHWMIDRYAVFNQFHIQAPQFNDAFLVMLLHWAMAIIVIAGALWGISALASNRRAKSERESTPVA